MASLERLLDSVNKFAAWWSAMEMALSNEGNARHLRPGENSLGVKGMKKAWTIIRNDYEHYADQVCQRIRMRPLDNPQSFVDSTATRSLQTR